MTKEEAYSIIGGTEHDFHEVVLESLFQHKQFLLKSVITPPVFQTRARKIAVLNEAYCVINGTNIEELPFQDFSTQLIINDLKSDSLLAFYRNYEKLISDSKLQFMQNNDPMLVAHYCFEIANIEDLKLHTIYNSFSNFDLTLDEEVKISDFVNSGSIIKELVECKLVSITESNIELIPTLRKDVIRSKKYVTFTRLKKNKDA